MVRVAKLLVLTDGKVSSTGGGRGSFAEMKLAFADRDCKKRGE
jgi:hypothetical protein